MTKNSPYDLARRAAEAVIWGMPVVNYDLMYQEMARKAKGVEKALQALQEGGRKN